MHCSPCVPRRAAPSKLTQRRIRSQAQAQAHDASPESRPDGAWPARESHARSLRFSIALDSWTIHSFLLRSPPIIVQSTYSLYYRLSIILYTCKLTYIKVRVFYTASNIQRNIQICAIGRPIALVRTNNGNGKCAAQTVRRLRTGGVAIMNWRVQ